MSFGNFVLGTCAGIALTLGGYYCVDSYILGNQHFNKIPKGKDIEEGYINPSDLEVKLLDLDDNKRKETALYIKNDRYLLKYDTNGEAELVKYKLKVIKEK